MADIVIKQNATAEDRASYFEALVETMLGISSAQSTLSARRSLTDSADETRYIDIQAHELEAEYNKLHAAEIAFLSNQFRFRPPSAETVASIKAMVQRLDVMVAASVRAQQVVEAVTGLLNLWRTTLA